MIKKYNKQMITLWSLIDAGVWNSKEGGWKILQILIGKGGDGGGGEGGAGIRIS